jgi:purine-cytosine permease-like protein
MLRHISLKRLFIVTWIAAFLADYCFRFYLIWRHGSQYETSWRYTAIQSTAVAGLVALIVKRIQEEPTKEEVAALDAIFQAGPGTIGAVVVTRHGVPEVVATVRSREEYLQLAASGRIPVDHFVFLPTDA